MQFKTHFSKLLSRFANILIANREVHSVDLQYDAVRVDDLGCVEGVLRDVLLLIQINDIRASILILNFEKVASRATLKLQVNSYFKYPLFDIPSGAIHTFKKSHCDCDCRSVRLG